MTPPDALERARDTVRTAEADDFAALIARKVEDLRHYDVPGMDRVVAACYLGRSGSLLLTSYLDGHDDVAMLPVTRGQRIYQFFEEHRALPLRDKLIAYPAFSERYGQPFFYGDFPISESDYEAAVEALFIVYGDRPFEFLASRRTFFQFIHAAYGVALGRRPRTPRPLMVHAQHSWEVAAAQRLVEDFPKALFIHTIRYPIRGFESWFDRVMHIETDDGEYPNRDYLKPALTVFEDMLAHDRPHPGMGERTRAARFNDLHLANAETLRLVTEWLGLPYRPSLRESTFNGLPFVAESNGTDWVGARSEQFGRPVKNLNVLDRIFLYALLHENFVAWGFLHPKIFHYVWARRIAVAVLRQVPTKMEFRAFRLVMRLQVRPALRRGEFGFAMLALARCVACRIEIARIVGHEFHRRIGGRWGRMEWAGGNLPGHFQVLGQNVPKAVERHFPILPQPSLDRPPNPETIARAAIGKYCDPDAISGQSLLDAVTDADDIDRAAALLAPIVQRVRDHVFAAEKIHATDKPVPMLDPATHRRTHGRAWIYVRDDRPSCGSAAPAVAFFHSPDRDLGQRVEHLRRFSGFLQADIRDGDAAKYNRALEPAAPIVEAACWARCRVKFCDVWGATQSEVAWEALRRIAAIYEIDARARQKPVAVRVGIRAEAKPMLDDFFGWAEAEVVKLYAESALAEAFRHMLARRPALSLFLDHGGLEIDNGRAETVLCGIAMDAETWSLAGRDDGGKHAAAIHTLIGSARLNGRDPQSYLRDVIHRLAAGHPADGVDLLLPWNWRG